jgi:predicted HNH restriction endonuclease
MICVECGAELKGKQTKFCSISCKNKNTNSRHNTYDVQKRRGMEIKLDCIDRLGGKCSACGYKKNLSAMEFHHIGKKTIKMTMQVFNTGSLNRILEELRVCILLCSNCHRELHYPDLEI